MEWTGWMEGRWEGGRWKGGRWSGEIEGERETEGVKMEGGAGGWKGGLHTIDRPDRHTACTTH